MSRMVGVVALVAVAALAGVGAWLALGSGEAGDETVVSVPPAIPRHQLSDVPLATLFYVGYGFDKHTYEATGGLGTRGWNVIQNDSLYEGFVQSKPEIGWYASKNESTIAWQLEQMQRAGINVVYISWQGWGDDDLNQSQGGMRICRVWGFRLGVSQE